MRLGIMMGGVALLLVGALVGDLWAQRGRVHIWQVDLWAQI